MVYGPIQAHANKMDEQLDSVATFSKADLEFHRMVYQFSRNSILAQFAEVILKLGLETRHKTAETYMQAINKQPGEIINIGFDTSPAVIDGFKKSYIQLTSDQQPFQQGYLPILSLCGSKVYGFAPLYVDTGAGFVDASNYEAVAEWANKGYR